MGPFLLTVQSTLPDQVGGWGVIGAVGLVAILLFRTLWRTDAGWLSLLQSAREDARIARAETAELRRLLERCEARHDALEDHLRELGIPLPPDNIE